MTTVSRCVEVVNGTRFVSQSSFTVSYTWDTLERERGRNMRCEEIKVREAELKLSKRNYDNSPL